MKMALASEGLLAGSGDEAARIEIAERIAHLNLMLGDRRAAVSYPKGAARFAVEAGDEPSRLDLERQLRQSERS
jgi:hypothetical protein